MLPYQNPQLDIEARLDDLMGRMTLEELICQTDQYSADGFTSRGPMGEALEIREDQLEAVFQGNSVGSVQPRNLTAAHINQIQRYAVEKTRLGIPFLFSEEALHGVLARDTTCFPQQIGLAATFDPKLSYQVGKASAAEARARGIGELFAPVMDLSRDPRYGRTEEAYGEDTYLGAQFAREMVLGLQGGDLTAPDAVAAEPKHFAAYGTPTGGLNCAPCANPKHEVWTDCLPIFEAAYLEAGAMNAMCSYTAVDGVPVSMDKELLTEVLREKWGMGGFVRSDMTAVSRLWDWFFITEDPDDAIRLGLEAGVDLQLFDFSHEKWLRGIVNLVEQGRMDRAVLENAARRVLRVKMMLGLFENPYGDEAREKRLLKCPEHLALAEKIADESLVLLKNQDGLLPLPKDLGTIAVVGPCADAYMLGDYIADGTKGVTLLEGVRAAVSGHTTILHEPGCGFLGDRAIPFRPEMLRDEAGNPGLTARYYNSRTPEGEPVVVRNDPRIDFNWIFSKPDPRVGSGAFSAAWTGTLVMDESFDGCIGFSTQDSMRLFVDGALILDGWGEYRSANRMVDFHFEAGRSYQVRIEFTNDQRGARVIFGYARGWEDLTPAVEAARKADVALVCVGDSQETCGENFDRVSLDLPGKQLELVKRVYETGTPVVLLLYSGRGVTCTWEQEHIPAILQCWFPGERGGISVAKAIFGDTNPSGRLPISFPRHVGQIPCHYSRRPGGGRRYVEMNWLPLYPFGYGQSYTAFEYRALALDKSAIAPGESVTAYVTVANVGSRAGTAVPQLYIRDCYSSTVKPERQLCGFARVELEPGEEQTVEIVIGPKSMRTLGRDYIWRIEPGDFNIYLCENAAESHHKASFKVQ